jgi:hypothetical protein
MSETQSHADPFEALQSVGNNMGLLAAEISRLVQSTTSMEAARRRNFRVTLAFAVVLTFALLLLSGLFFLVQESASDIRSCVTPTGLCYQQQQARADKARTQLDQVANNNRYFTLATQECALGSPTAAEYNACVLEKVGARIYPTPPK